MTGISFLVLLGTGMPIAFVLIATTYVFLYMADRLPVLDAVPQIAFGSVETFDLLAIPLFVMLGEIMNEGGLTRRIFRAARAWLTRVRHDLPLVNLIANLALAAIMGSATAQIAVMSRTVVPEMEKAGYDRGYSTAITAAAGLLGPIIPPSMILIMAAKVFGWVLTFNQIPQAVAAFIASLTQDPTIFMILVMLSLVAVGMFLDGIAALIIMVPILLPVATATYGIDPVQFGIMVSMTLVLGLLTPPVGAGLYIAAAISQVEITRLSKLVAPYVLASVLVIFIVILFPWVVRPF